jgi:hypothetical protein
MMPQIVIFNQIRAPPNLFKDFKGAEKLKRLKNTMIDGKHGDEDDLM